MYNIKTGQTYNIDEVNSFNIVDREGNTMKQIPVEHDTRGLLNLVNKGMFSDYDYMPVTSKDMAQMVALNMEANSGSYAIAKLIGTVVGGATPIGAGLGFMLTNLGTEIYETAKTWGMKDNPREFWNTFVNNVNEIKDNDDSFVRFLDGANIGSSYFSKGASEALYKDWGDVISQNGSYTAGNVIGNIVKTTAAISAWGAGAKGASASQNWSKISSALMTDYWLSDSLGEMGRQIGVGTEVWESVKIGALNGLASGAAAWATLKTIPWIARTVVPELVSAYQNYGAVNALTNAGENALWYAGRQALGSMLTGEDYAIDPLTTGTMFGLGFFLSYGGYRLSQPKLRQEAMDRFKQLPKEYTPSTHQLEFSNADVRNRPFSSFFGQTDETISKLNPKEYVTTVDSKGKKQTVLLDYKQYKALENKQALMLEYKNADSRNMPISFWDNTSKELRPEETLELGKALAARDRVFMRVEPTAQSFIRNFTEDYEIVKKVTPSLTTAESVATNYKGRVSTLWDSGMDTMSAKAVMPNDMSKAAQEIVMENLSMLAQQGIIKDQADATRIARLVYETAKKKGGNAGNFEVRQAFAEIIGD